MGIKAAAIWTFFLPTTTASLTQTLPSPPPGPSDSCRDLVAILGDASAQNHQGGVFGEYVFAGAGINNRDVYRQRYADPPNFLYYAADIKNWCAGPTVGSSTCYIANTFSTTAACPTDPVEWDYFDGSTWISGGISVTYPSPPSPPCSAIVSVKSSTVTPFSGEYVMSSGTVVCGRPTYEQSSGTHSLWFHPALGVWYIGDTVDFEQGNRSLYYASSNRENADCPEGAGPWHSVAGMHLSVVAPPLPPSTPPLSPSPPHPYTQPPHPYPMFLPPFPPCDDCESHPLDTGIVAGIAVGAAALVVLIIVGAMIYHRRRRHEEVQLQLVREHQMQNKTSRSDAENPTAPASAGSADEALACLLEGNHVTWTTQEVELNSWVATGLHVIHSSVCLLKSAITLLEPLIESVPFCANAPPLMRQVVHALFHPAKVFFLYFSRPHSVLLEARDTDGQVMRSLATDERPFGARVCSGFIGWPPVYHAVAALDATCSSIGTILRVQCQLGRYNLMTASGGIIATWPYGTCSMTSKEAVLANSTFLRRLRVFMFDADGKRCVEIIRKRPCFTFPQFCGEALPNTITKSTTTDTKSWITFTSTPASICSDYIFPLLSEIAVDAEPLISNQLQNANVAGIELQNVISTVQSAQEALEKANEVHEAVENEEEVVQSATEVVKKLKGVLESYRVVGTSKTKYIIETNEMSSLQKASALLYVLQEGYNRHRVH